MRQIMGWVKVRIADMEEDARKIKTLVDTCMVWMVSNLKHYGGGMREMSLNTLNLSIF